MKNKKEVKGIREKKEEYMNWEKSIDDGNKRKRLEVEEAENGFIITISIDDHIKDSYTRKKYISEKNPLEKTTPIEVKNTDLLEEIDTFINDF